jgi:hypothetical protein
MCGQVRLSNYLPTSPPLRMKNSSTHVVIWRKIARRIDGSAWDSKSDTGAGGSTQLDIL